ncbi:PIN domain-containing protein [bacterium]|nr:PIN domain-containing protein [bacterium]MCI0618777.1 PIN domain-containing protein [bacterium]
MDTSVWVDFFRGKNKKIGEEIQSLLDSDEIILAAPVRIEILSGCSKNNFKQLRQLLSALPVFYPKSTTWERIESWIEDAIFSGEKFGMGDLLIASIAVDQNSAIWSLDTDFRRMEKIGWLKLHHLS